MFENNLEGKRSLFLFSISRIQTKARNSSEISEIKNVFAEKPYNTNLKKINELPKFNAIYILALRRIQQDDNKVMLYILATTT